MNSPLDECRSMNLAKLKALINELEDLELTVDVFLEARNASGDFVLVRQEHVTIVVGGEPQVKIRIDPSLEK